MIEIKKFNNGGTYADFEDVVYIHKSEVLYPKRVTFSKDRVNFFGGISTGRVFIPLSIEEFAKLLINENDYHLYAEYLI